jgi:small subunit ribosomal protein S6
MRRYETFVIIDPDISPENREPVLERVKELIAQQDGFLIVEDVWGERKMAYEIKKKERGFYVRFDYCGLAPLVNEIERYFRIDDRALKYMTVVLDKDVDLEKVKEEKAALESQRQSEAALQDTPTETESTERHPETESTERHPETESTERHPETDPESGEIAAEQEPIEEEAIPVSDQAESGEPTIPAPKKEEA